MPGTFSKSIGLLCEEGSDWRRARCGLTQNKHGQLDRASF